MTSEKAKNLLTARVLHSKFSELGPPESVNRAIQGWLRELENEIRAERTSAFADDINVADSAEIGLVNVRGKHERQN